MKDEGTEKEFWKARIVFQRHRDKLERSLVHDMSVSREYFKIMLIGIVVVCGLRLLYTEVTQAYIKSAKKLNRDIYLNPPIDLNLKSNKIIPLLKTLYRLADSGDYWGSIF